MKVTINKYTQRFLKNNNLKIEKVEISADRNGHLEFYMSLANTQTKESRAGTINIEGL